jgi:hypothetical protein
MSLPGFTAEVSLYASSYHYSATAVGVSERALVQPQYEYPLPPTPCSLLSFCCLEFGDASCCRRWRLLCFPE